MVTFTEPRRERLLARQPAKSAVDLGFVRRVGSAPGLECRAVLAQLRVALVDLALRGLCRAKTRSWP
jgi:hypothetical protein